MSDSNIRDENTNFRHIALVAGYHPCSFPPATAYDAGLKERFAVVLSSYRPDKDDMFFDAELFVLIAGSQPNHAASDITVRASASQPKRRCKASRSMAIGLAAVICR